MTEPLALTDEDLTHLMESLSLEVSSLRQVRDLSTKPDAIDERINASADLFERLKAELELRKRRRLI